MNTHINNQKNKEAHDMSQLVTNFLNYLLTEKRVSENTFDAYKRDISQVEAYATACAKNVEDLEHMDLVEFLSDLHSKKNTASTIARKVATMKHFFNFIHKKYTLPNKGIFLETPKKEKRLPHYLQESEISKLFQAAQEDSSEHGIRNYIMLLLLYSSGVRITELVSLTMDDVDIKHNCIKVKGKGSKERLVPVPEHVIKIIEEYIATTYPKLLIKNNHKIDTPFLFPTYYDGQLKAMTRQSFWIYLKRIAIEAGITQDFSPHTLRHSLATHLLKNGLHLRSLQTLLGHEQLSTVQIYTHVDTSHLRKIYDKKHPRS